MGPHNGGKCWVIWGQMWGWIWAVREQGESLTWFWVVFGSAFCAISIIIRRGSSAVLPVMNRGINGPISDILLFIIICNIMGFMPPPFKYSLVKQRSKVITVGHSDLTVTSYLRLFGHQREHKRIEWLFPALVLHHQRHFKCISITYIHTFHNRRNRHAVSNCDKVQRLARRQTVSYKTRHR